MTYQQFKTILEKKPTLKNYNSEALAKKFSVDVNVIKEYRELIKTERKEVIEFENNLIPTEEELEATNYKVESKLENKIPESIKGFEVTSFKLNKDGNVQERWYKKLEGKELQGSIEEIDWNMISKTLLKNIKPVKTNKNIKGKILTICLGDAHIGMSVSKDAPLDFKVLNFQDSLLKTLDLINEPFEEVVVIYGGDMVDSVLNYSSRGGHYLPSTMTDREMFETFIEGSKTFFSSLAENPLVGKVSFYSVAQDNHTGYITSIQSRALELWLNVKYPDIETRVFNENIDFYTKKNHIYIIMHGKDSKNQVKNLPLILDTKTESYLMSWCLSKGITPNYKNTHIIKFDLHQSSYQLGRFFSYLNCLSMQIGSDWQQYNFMSSCPGVSYCIQSDNGIQNGELFL